MLAQKPEGKRRLGRSGRRWEDNDKIDLEEIEWNDVHWTNLSHDGDHWRDVVTTVMNLWVL
jgi:hypothetical protein